MRVVTTCHKEGLEQYGHRWLDSRKAWPEATEFRFYTEGFRVPCPDKDLSEIEDFARWRAKHAYFHAPDWRFNFLKFSCKVFAAADALMDYDGVGVWLDADCVTYKEIPEGLIESQVSDAYLACYQRTGSCTETGLWIVNCAAPEHRDFLNAMRDMYLSNGFRNLPEWHDCYVMDAVIKKTGVKVNNLSGEHAKHFHPQAVSELGRYIDHCKGSRKESGVSGENKYRADAMTAMAGVGSIALVT